MKHRMLWHRGIALILALLLAMSSLAGLPQTVRAESIGEDGPETPAQAVADAAPDVGTEVSGVLQDDPSAELPALVTEGYQSGDRVRIIVETENEPLAESAVAFADGALTTQGLRMQQTAKSRHEALANEIAAIQKQENSGAAAAVRYDYTLLLDGFAVECDYGCLEEIRALPGVRDAYVAEQYELPTTPQMSSSNQMIGSAAAWGAGYDGSGMVVAVLDTSIDTDHDAFAVDPKTPSMTKQSVQTMLAQQELNAEKRKSISADQVYLSAKLPFVFDYADNDTDVNHHGGSYHGTHVAGTIAGNPADGTISGVAPKAQLVIMKVFSDSGTNAYSDDILAALEDCLKLGVDAINMSLGSVAGFTSRPDQLATMNVYDNLEKAGIVVAAAAGNEYSAAYKNMWDTNKSLTSNPDYGVVGSPSSYLQAFSVASVDNQLVESNYFQVGDRKISFTDTAKSYAPGKEFVTQLGGKTLSYVLIPGVGKAEDYGALDVTGKIAVVSRGDTAFADKYAVAEQKGAAGCIIYNNEPGLINMSIESYTIPAIFIDKADGDAMIAAAKDGVGTLTVHTDTYQAVSSTGGLPSDFSSWGTTADLTITPDLMAPGGNIYSAEDNNTYGLMSGTSMATPHIAGAAALMLQYLRSTTDLKGRDAMDRAYALMMSTAGPAKDAGGATASPRKQGAGRVNLNAAISTDAYLSVEGNSRPKLELGEDEEQTGVYTLTFSVNNTSKQTLEYAISPVILTENAENGGTYNGQDVYFAAQTARDITADCTWTASTGTTVTASAGANGTITPAGETEYFYESKAVYKMTPAEGYHVASVLVDGVYVGTMSAYTFDSLTEDHTIAVTFARTEHMVTYVDGLNGQTVAILYAEDGGSVIPPQAPAHTGYTFSGWSADSDNITADTVITANYETANCTVTFLDRDGGIISTGSVPYGTAPQVPGRTGHTFTGWDGSWHNVKSDLVLTAQFRQLSYTVVFVDGLTGEQIAVATVPYGTAAEKPDAPTHDGYVFLGWDTDTACVKEDLTVIALYEKQDVPTDPTRPTDPEKPENPTEPTKPDTDSEPQTPPTGDGAAPRLAALAGCAALLAAGLMLQSRKRKRQS